MNNEWTEQQKQDYEDFLDENNQEDTDMEARLEEEALPEDK